MRFDQFNDDELYMLKRAMIEAEKYIFQNETNYTDEECNVLNDLLNESIENIKYRDNERRN